MDLTVAIASRNEIPMLMMTVLSAVEAIREADITGEVFIVENSDPDQYPAVLDALAGQLKDGTVRVVREERPSMAVAIDRSHREAHGELIFWTDAHALVGANAIRSLVNFYRSGEVPNLGYLHCAIQWAHRSRMTRRTHFDLRSTKMGAWGEAAVTVPRPVSWKGMPYLVSKETYIQTGGLGCLAEHRAGWGVLRYLGIKPWLLGYENWAIPDGTVYHFGEWPESCRKYARYRTYRQSGDVSPGWPYAVAAYVMGGESFLREEFLPAGMARYFDNVETAVREAVRIGQEDREWMLVHQKISLQDLLEHPPWGRPSTIPDCDGPAPTSGATITEEYRSLNAGLHADQKYLYGYAGDRQADLVKSIAKRFRVASILDYGAGKQTLSAALRSMGCKDVRDYDPAIPAIASRPEPADLVVCSDVLEHCEPALLDNVVADLARVTKKLMFVRVCTVPCVSKQLPDGSDPHRIVHPRHWWLDILGRSFDPVESFELSDQYFSLVLRPVR